MTAIDDDPGSTRPMRRPGTATIPDMVPLIEIDRRIHALAATLRLEWIANIDRQALERARDEARDAVVQITASSAVSHRRWMTLIVVHAVTGLLIAATCVALGMQIAYGRVNRVRIERLERVTDQHKETP